jgi:hypothetical protein
MANAIDKTHTLGASATAITKRLEKEVSRIKQVKR